MREKKERKYSFNVGICFQPLLLRGRVEMCFIKFLVTSIVLTFKKIFYLYIYSRIKSLKYKYICVYARLITLKKISIKDKFLSDTILHNIPIF